MSSSSPIPFKTEDGSISLLEHADPEDITVLVSLDIKISESTPFIDIFKLAGNLLV